MLTSSQNESDTSRTKAILNMKQTEKQKQAWHRINQVCGNKKRGLRTIHVPSTVEGDKKWNLVSEKQEMKKKIIDQNVNHFSASASTLFGKGKFFNQLHDKNTRRSTIQKLLRGSSGWRHKMKEVENFI